MNSKNGKLFVIATPIGNLKDISLRALETLKEVDLIAAEDTRHSKKLLQHYGIKKAMTSLHDYNEKQKSNVLLDILKFGKNIALISDAGTPLISDPGYNIVNTMRNNNIEVIPIPGACAAIAALSISGLPTDRFVFEGFLPSKSKQLESRLIELKNIEHTLIFYESPKRIVKLLIKMSNIFGEDRNAFFARELTKTFEQVCFDNIKNILDFVKNDLNQQKGEIVLLVHGAKKDKGEACDNEIEKILKILSSELPASQAAKLAAKIFSGTNKKLLYKKVLDMKR